VKNEDEEVLKRAEFSKLLLENKYFVETVNYVHDEIDNAMLNCKFEKKGDADKLVLSKILFNKLMQSFILDIEKGSHYKNLLAKKLLAERRELETKDPIFNRDAS